MSEATLDVSLLVSLFSLEGSGAIVALAVYKRGERAVAPFLASRAGIVLLLASLLAVIALVVVVRRVRRTRGTWRFRHTVALNVVAVTAGLATGEATVRGLASRTPLDVTFGGTTLLPHDWRAVAAHNRHLLQEASRAGSYFVFDEWLGWTVGRGRTSANGLYFSSLEGIRSPRPGMSFESRKSKPRVALVGDSFTFGLEVGYEASWGHLLERELGGRVEILNFGVDGYGVDQAYLRYLRDVRSWRPDLIIFGMIDHDLERTMGVYGFLTFPGSELPFPKPRMVVRERGIEPLNVPLRPAEDIFTAASISELPYIDYDRGYDPTEWEWRPYHHSYLLRFVVSRFPRGPTPRREIDDQEMIALNREIVREFVERARADGATPLLVYFPSRSRFEGPASAPLPQERPAQQLLRTADLPHVDLTGCVATVDPRDRFVIGHYSARTNAAVAACLAEPVSRHLEHRTRSRRSLDKAAAPS